MFVCWSKFLKFIALFWDNFLKLFKVAFKLFTSFEGENFGGKNIFSTFLKMNITCVQGVNILLQLLVIF